MIGSWSRRTSSRCIGAGAAALVVLALAVPAAAELLQYGDGFADGKKSIGGGGHLIFFDAGRDGCCLNRVEMYGSRYGYPQPPDEDFHLYVVSANGAVLKDIALPYSLWERGQEYWRDLPVPPIQVPRVFGIGLAFNAEQTKGVYVGTDAVAQGHSYSWLPGQQGEPLAGLDWMVRVDVGDEAIGAAEADDLFVLKNGEAHFDQFESAEGDPLVIRAANLGLVQKADVASIRFGAVSSPTMAPQTTSAVVTLGTLPCDIVSADENGVRVRDADGQEMVLPQSALRRIDFR